MVILFTRWTYCCTPVKMKTAASASPPPIEADYGATDRRHCRQHQQQQAAQRHQFEFAPAAVVVRASVNSSHDALLCPAFCLFLFFIKKKTSNRNGRGENVCSLHGRLILRRAKKRKLITLYRRRDTSSGERTAEFVCPRLCLQWQF